MVLVPTLRKPGEKDPCPLPFHLPSSGSSLAQVSAVIRLAIKWWPMALAADEDVEPWELGPAKAGEAAKGSGRGSLPVSMLSSWTWAMLRGCRSFCTAWKARRLRTPHGPMQCYYLLYRLSHPAGPTTHHLGSCLLVGTSSVCRPGTGCDGLYPLGTFLPLPGICRRQGAPGGQRHAQAPGLESGHLLSPNNLHPG